MNKEIVTDRMTEYLEAKQNIKDEFINKMIIVGMVPIISIGSIILTAMYYGVL